MKMNKLTKLWIFYGFALNIIIQVIGVEELGNWIEILVLILGILMVLDWFLSDMVGDVVND